MGTFARNVLMACVAAITLLLAGCNGNTSSTPTPGPSSTENPAPYNPADQLRVVNMLVPATPDDINLMEKYSIVVGASTLTCGNKGLPHLDLPLSGETKGFQGDTIKVLNLADGGLIRIEWDKMSARSLIVNKKLWAPVDTLANPPLVTNLQAADWGGKITSIQACNWQM